MANRNPFLAAFEKSLAGSESLQEARDLIASGAKSAVDRRTGLVTPKKLEEAHGLARQGSKGAPGLHDEFMVEHGGKMWNIAPNASPVVMMPSGKVVNWPKDRMHQIPDNATMLNKTEADIDRLIPRPRPGTEFSTKPLDVGQRSPVRSFPLALTESTLLGTAPAALATAAGGAGYYGLTGKNPIAGAYGASGQQPSFANVPLSPDYIASAANVAPADAVVQKAEDVVAPAAGGSSPRQLSNDQILELARKSITPDADAQDDSYGYTGPMGAYLQGSIDASRSAPSPAAPAPAPAPARAPLRNGIPQAGAPLPVRRPDSIGQLPGAKPASQEGFFSRIFGQDPYAGKTASQLMETANQNPDSAAAFFRADQALRKERPEMFEQKTDDTQQGAKRGGAINGRDAALHKALEIIHHMISRGR
jgi:hypothetical protein